VPHSPHVVLRDGLRRSFTRPKTKLAGKRHSFSMTIYIYKYDSLSIVMIEFSQYVSMSYYLFMWVEYVSMSYYLFMWVVGS
jgi:hypothetical protein